MLDVGMDEEERQRLLALIRADHPTWNLDAMVGGSLAGPTTPDRPDVPPWHYREFSAANPEWTLEALIAVRYPTRLPDGDLMVISVAEYVIDPGVEGIPGYRLARPRARDAEAVLTESEDLFAAGLVAWESPDGVVAHLTDLDTLRAFLEARAQRR